jgi:hypothetical protein
VFDQAGEYLLSFTAQITSTSASTANFWFWPRVNGTDTAGSTIKASLHQNAATTVVSRTVIFYIDANDYVEFGVCAINTCGDTSNNKNTCLMNSKGASLG